MGTVLYQSNAPIVMLPVRIETRFTKNPNVLRIRVYPDAAHIDSHEPQLTDIEIAEGKRYWRRVHGARLKQERRDAAWSQLADSLGAERAAWVARSLRPDNLKSDSDEEPVFREPAEKDSAWNAPAYVRLMPTIWRAIGYLDGEDPAKTESLPIRLPLRYSFDPNRNDDSIAWVTDFAEAKKCGMAMELPLSKKMAEVGLDRLLVYGVREGQTPEGGAGDLAALLESHYYTHGLSFLPPGAPTNNTESVSAENGPESPGYIEAYRVEARDAIEPVINDADSAALRLTRGLGLPSWTPRGAGRALMLAAGAGSRDEAYAGPLSQSLWGAALGYYLSQILVEGSGEDDKRMDKKNLVHKNAFLKYIARLEGKPASLKELDRDTRARFLVKYGFITSYEEALDFVRNVSYGDWSDALTKIGRAIHWEKNKFYAPGFYTTIAVNALKQMQDEALNEWEAAEKAKSKDDWYAAENELQEFRTKYFAYYRYLWRQKHGMPGSALDDWLAAEAAAGYGRDRIWAARAHAARYLRPGGPFAAIRISNQPYGILPATSLDFWRSGEEDAGLATAIRRLRDGIWLPAAGKSARIGGNDRRKQDKVLDDLKVILSTSPLNQELKASVNVTTDALYNIKRFADRETAGEFKTNARLFKTGLADQKSLDDIRVLWQPKSASLQALTPPINLSGPVAGTGAGLKRLCAWLVECITAGTIPLERISKLLSDEDYLPANLGERAPLLYKFLRHSFLRDIADSMLEFMAAPANSTIRDREHLEPEYARLASQMDHLASKSDWEDKEGNYMYWDEPHVWYPLLKLRAYNGRLSMTGHPGATGLRNINASLDALRALAAAPEEELAPERMERLFRQALDASSHRLDAWITSFATRRLDELRKAGVSGALTGGYAWVEDLRPVEATGDHDGYIHAPSLNQALTAGILRSAYKAHEDDDYSNSCAIQLPSWRVRTAEWLLDGMRGGQSLSSLGGYIFERSLHESKADLYIDAFRKIADLKVTVVIGGDEADPAPTQTTDGVKLRDMWHEGRLDAFIRDNKQYEREIVGALQALSDALDSVADCLVAESVHSVVSGNFARASAILDMMYAGEGNIPELEFLRTARSGNNITHRLLLLAPAIDAGPANSFSERFRPRAIASPRLNRLAASLLPRPELVRCAVRIGRDGEEALTVDVLLSECACCALDYIYETKHGIGEMPVALKLAVIDAAYASADLPVDYGAAELLYGRGDHWAPEDIGIPAFLQICDAVRLVFSRARPLTPDDLAMTYNGPIAPRRDPELASCVSEVGNLLEGLLENPSLHATAALGVNEAAQALYGAGDPLAEAAAAHVQERAEAMRAVDDNPSENVNRNNTAKIKAVFGEDFLAGPAFTALETGETGRAVLNGKSLSTATEARRHLAAAAKIRPAASAAQRYFLLNTAYKIEGFRDIRTAQLPVGANDKWVGESIKNGELECPFQSYVIWGADALHYKDETEIFGLVLDEWNETIPDAEQMTGLAFHFNSPAAEPPQAVLIAVQPNADEGVWTTDILEHILWETLDLAKIRSVGRRELAQTISAPLAPAIYMAENPSGDVVSTRLFERG